MDHHMHHAVQGQWIFPTESLVDALGRSVIPVKQFSWCGRKAEGHPA